MLDRVISISCGTAGDHEDYTIDFRMGLHGDNPFELVIYPIEEKKMIAPSFESCYYGFAFLKPFLCGDQTVRYMIGREANRGCR